MGPARRLTVSPARIRSAHEESRTAPSDASGAAVVDGVLGILPAADGAVGDGRGQRRTGRAGLCGVPDDAALPGEPCRNRPAVGERHRRNAGDLGRIRALSRAQPVLRAKDPDLVDDVPAGVSGRGGGVHGHHARGQARADRRTHASAGGDKLVFAYSMAGLFMGYVYFSIPRVVLTIMAAAEKLNPAVEEAARSLARLPGWSSRMSSCPP